MTAIRMSEPRATKFGSPRPRIRTDIQALRAIAVAAVLIYHLWPNVLPGGYVGVDVFFVVSGFLITGHLVREHARSGRIDLPAFWVRRIRRLLPAAFTVLVATIVGVVVWVPPAYWAGFMREIASAAVIVENWVLAGSSVDYLAADALASPVQHYWSLSVEEQFYLVWPVVLAMALGWARWRTRGVLVLVAAASIVSLVSATVMVAQHNAAAYFVTTARVWEFAVGALLAIVVERSTRGESPAGDVAWRTGVAVVGVCALAASFVWFDSGTNVPGPVTLVPVLGAAAVIASGDRSRGPLAAAFRARPVQRLGAISYSAYLWHWPLIVIAPFALERTVRWWELAGVLAVTLLLAEGTHRWIENRWRRGPVTWRVFGAAGVAALVLVGSAWVVGERASSEADAPVAAAATSCLGAASWVDQETCADHAWADVTPARTAVEGDVSAVYDDSCRTSPVESELKACEFGVQAEAATASVVLAGDSHAAQWFPALEALATQRDWHLTVIFKGACPFSDAAPELTDDDHRPSCVDWNGAVMDVLRAAPPDVVVTSATRSYAFDADDDTSARVAAQGLSSRWRALGDLGIQVVALEDTPQMAQEQLRCVAASSGAAPDCARDTSEALAGAAVIRDAAAHVPDVVYVDANPFLCTTECPAVISGAVVYRDTSSHMTETFGRSLAPWLGQQLDGVSSGAH